MTAVTTATHVRRHDIQGLRAFAVLVVVGDHLIGRPAGGFIGVDVFFVISGYLITGILWREYERSGRISLLGFFKRRIKRTVPVAWVVVAATLAAFALLLPFAANQQARNSSIAASMFWINWQLISDGADYLKASAPPTVFQHYWSLAVEEQFYLVWPLLVLAVAALVRRRPKVARLALLLTFAAVALASYLWAIHLTAAQPSAAYFSTFTRAWELAAGAIVALAAPLTRRIPRGWGIPVSWAGMAVLLASVAVIDQNSPFPAPWALVPVLGTVLVLVSGEGRASEEVYPLTNPVSQFVGNISFSIYLWHFPVVIAMQDLQVPTTPRALVCALAVMVGLSTLSYYVIEEPFRRSSWRVWRYRPHLRPPRWTVAVGAVCVIVIVVGALGINRERTMPELVPAANTAELWATVVDTPADDPQRQRAIAKAVEPEPVPASIIQAVSHGVDRRAAAWVAQGCMVAQTVNPCIFGDKNGEKTAVLYGDSIAVSYLPAVRAALAGSSWRIVVYTAGQCPAFDVAMLNADGSANVNCDDFHRRARAAIALLKPDVLVISSSFLSQNYLADKQQPQLDVWGKAAESAFLWMSSAAGKVVVLDAPPLLQPAEGCLPVALSNRACMGTVRDDYVRLSLTSQAALERSGAKNVTYVPTVAWYCTESGICPSYIGSEIPLANDGEHPSERGAEALGPLLRKVWPVPLTSG